MDLRVLHQQRAPHAFARIATAREARRGSRSVRLAAVGLLCHSVIAHAYQTDVHYGLTNWLAGKAGFTPAESHEIARGNEMTDIGQLDAVHAIVYGMCAEPATAEAEQASKIARDLHFRSQEPVPNPPAARPVASSASFAGSETRRWLTDASKSGMDRLWQFGQALHGWQDAFAHGGVADKPPWYGVTCREVYFWSHPKKAGAADGSGAASTIADQTHDRARLCVQAADSSYHLPVDLRKQVGLQAPTAPWADLAAPVAEFCGAPTKRTKADWFKAHNVPQALSIVRLTTLPDGSPIERAPELNLLAMPADGKLATVDTPIYTYATRTVDSALQRRIDAVVAAAPKPSNDGSEQWFAGLFKAWLGSDPRDLKSVVAEYVDVSSPQLGGSADAAIERLQRWRLFDRGLAEAPALLISRAAADQFVRGSFEPLLVPARGRQQPYLVFSTDGPKGKQATAIAVFRHAPYEVALLRAERRAPSGFRLVELQTLAAH